MPGSSANVTSMHLAPIGQSGSTNAEPVATTDSLGSLSKAGTNGQLASHGSNEKTSSTEHALFGVPPASPLSKPPRLHAPVPLSTLNSRVAAAAGAQMPCDSVERSMLTHRGSS